MTEVKLEPRSNKDVKRDLRFWGKQLHLLLLQDGHADRSAIDRIFEGVVHLNGHNVLIRDMKEPAWSIHQQVMRLAWLYRDALVAAYAVPPKPDGTVYSRRELARLVNCSFEAYKKRVKRAESMIKAV